MKKYVGYVTLLVALILMTVEPIELKGIMVLGSIIISLLTITAITLRSNEDSNIRKE